MEFNFQMRKYPLWADPRIGASQKLLLWAYTHVLGMLREQNGWGEGGRVRTGISRGTLPLYPSYVLVV